MLFCFAVALAGCVTPPKSPAELREAVSGGLVMGSQSQVFTVNRAYPEVLEHMKKKWTNCLAQSVTLTMRNPQGYFNYTKYQLIPTVSVKGKHAELHLQQKQLGRQAIMTGGKLPDDGFYTIVFDIDEVNAQKTRINMQTLPMTGLNFDSVLTAGKSWAEGGNAGCPDLSK